MPSQWTMYQAGPFLDLESADLEQTDSAGKMVCLWWAQDRKQVADRADPVALVVVALSPYSGYLYCLKAVLAYEVFVYNRTYDSYNP